MTPEEHYNLVTEAWRYLLGEDLHYGFFQTPTDALPEATNELIVEMARRAPLSKDMRVLDVGCGIGNPAFHLVSEFGCDVMGISNSQVGIDLANTRAKEKRLDLRARFAYADAVSNGLPDANFDCTWLMESSHLMPDKAGVVAECSRVLRPGGTFALCDIIQRRPIPLAEVIRHAKAFNLLRLVFGRAKMLTLAEYEALAHANGLMKVRLEDITKETEPTFDRWEENATKNRAAVVALIGEERWQQFFDSCGVLREFWRDGVLGYGFVFGTKG